VKSTILDAFIHQTGYERKYVIHLPANEGIVKFVGKNLKVKVSPGSWKNGGTQRFMTMPSGYPSPRLAGL
jgi:hypothetical protein